MSDRYGFDFNNDGKVSFIESHMTYHIYCHMFQEAQARTSDVIANALDFNKNKGTTTADRPAV